MNQSIGETKLKKIVEQLFKDLEADPDSITRWGHEVKLEDEEHVEVYVVCGSTISTAHGVIRYSLDNAFLVARDNFVEMDGDLVKEDIDFIEHEIDNHQ
jgi:hypothetical protein